MISVLINAYACAPNMGSEPGMAWNWIVNLSKYCKVYVITEGEWEEEIEATIKQLPQGENIKFYYNPVSAKIRKMCWNQGDWRFYYYYKKWQRNALKLARNIMDKNQIDVVHQLNMIGFREPGYLWKIEKIPFIWGPIGGIRNFPESYLEGVDMKMGLILKLKNKINIFQIKNDIRVKKALCRANVLLSAIPETKQAIFDYHHLQSELISETGCLVNEKLKNNLNRFLDENKFDILWVGKFDFRKQLSLALKSIAQVKHLNGLKFHVVGTGNQNQIKQFKNLVSKLEIENLVIWHTSIPNNDVLELMRKSNLFFFTSVSEDTSTVIMEAISSNLPVLCFNSCGFGPIINDSVGMKIEFSNPRQSMKEFANKIEYLYSNRESLYSMSSNCVVRQHELSWDKKATQIIELYNHSVKNFVKNY